MQTFNIHIIKKNETLKSIAELYDLSEDELKNFHNRNGVPKENILIGITTQKELFLPRNAVLDKAKLVKFGNGNRLIFDPKNSFYNYGVMITIENEERKNEIKYEASVKWLKTENALHYFEIDRTSKLYINEEEINDIADLLAYKTSKVLYPMQISVDETGKFNSVENLGIFKDRWETIKEEVYKEFEGEIVEDYLLKIEQKIDEPEIISLLIKNDYFIRTLFFGVYQKFGKAFNIDGLESFPVIDNAIEPLYKIDLEIDPLKDDYDLVNIEGHGTLNEERSVYDLINGAPFSFLVEEEPIINSEGNFRLQFFMNGKTNLPESMYLECDILLGERKKVSVVISNLEG
ncbi:hypothetical protein FNJ88_07095 [Chryseobacterium sp. SNU WT5]|uniref:hypothetical protein n=1 Tax=Chryseobacterium sp. SNU WT5 TaxID=2594269 RepID=UPI00117C3F1D|nr:hypothetical protein [Chryseobacterium sp. SNU WT5]QDP85340.1 hypothetical protein FNJ88_07095 [Chryseobacterium sp. SNU WT5]